ncbi:hypothetical protein Tco_1168135 [Tanacetum coccineum]
MTKHRISDPEVIGADQEEARKKKRKKHATPRTPFGSPPSSPPPPPHPTGTSGALGISGTSGSSQLLPPPPPPSTGASGSPQQAGSKAPRSSKPVASTHQSMAWTTSDTRFELTNFTAAQELTPTDSLMQDDSTPDEQAYEVVKSFYPDVIYLQFQIEECRKMFTDQIDWTNPKGDQGSNPALSISKMKAASYPDFGLELLVPEQMWIDNVPESASSARSSRSSSWFRQTDDIYCCQAMDPKLGDSTAGYEFKHDYTIIESPRAVVFPVDNNDRKIMRFNKIYKFSYGTLTRILEALDYRVKEFKVKRLNPGMNTQFWTQKDVTRSKEFITAIERLLKTRRISRNLECFVGGHVRDIDYRLLQRTE